MTGRPATMDGDGRNRCITNVWSDGTCEASMTGTTGRRRKTGSTPRLHRDRNRTHGGGQLLLYTASAVLLSSVQNAHLVQAKPCPWGINTDPAMKFVVKDDRLARAESRTKFSSHPITPSPGTSAATAAARRSGKCRLGCNISLVTRIPRGGTSKESGAKSAASTDAPGDLSNGQHNVEDVDEDETWDDDELDQAHVSM